MAAGISTALSSALSSYISADATASHTAVPTTLTTTRTSAGQVATATETFYPPGVGPAGNIGAAGSNNNFPAWAAAPIIIGAIVLFFLIWLAVTKLRYGYFGFGIKRWQRIRRSKCDQCGRSMKGVCSYCTPIFNPAAEAEAARGFQQPVPAKRGADIALEEFYRNERDKNHVAPPEGYYGRHPRSTRLQDTQRAALQDPAGRPPPPPTGKKGYFKSAMGRMNQPLYV